jgi:hypothetical protein
MAAPLADPPATDASSVPPVPQPSVPQLSLPQTESGSNQRPVEGDRSADSQGLEPQGGFNDSLVITLAEASRQFDGTGADPERNCWMAVHQHVHGVLPSEYDIREIDEDLYLAVLAYRCGQDAGPVGDLSGGVPLS